MGAKIPVKQFKLTCRKKSNKFDIESLDKKEKDKLIKATTKYIFNLELLAEAECDTQTEVNAWKEEHPDVIGKNVVKYIKDCVNNVCLCYLNTVSNGMHITEPTSTYMKIDNGCGIAFKTIRIAWDSNNNNITINPYF